MDFLLEPIINIDTELLPNPDTKTKACCSDGSGCSSGVATNFNVEEV
ncbi:MAG: hypothetical protein WAM82_21850 [Thermoanaerobaculia bacterium]